MKLSQAIRKGAKLRPMAYGEFFHWDRNKCMGSCALGAAYEAITGSKQAFPWDIAGAIGAATGVILDERKVFFEGQIRYLDRAITYANDTLKWTREAIADWLEGEGY